MYMEAVGGIASVALSNACYACSTCYTNSATTQFQIHNLDLFKEMIEASGDLKANPFPADLMGPATRKIIEAGENLGFFLWTWFMHSRLLTWCKMGCYTLFK